MLAVTRRTHQHDTFQDLLRLRFGRRDALKLGGVAATAATLPKAADVFRGVATPARNTTGTATRAAVAFAPLQPAPTNDDAVRVPAGYVVDVVARWGDPIFAGAPAFDLGAQSAARQEQQVGYNHDFQAFFPLGDGSTEAVLWVNHEFTAGALMFPGYDPMTTDMAQLKTWTDIELAAHGGTVMELERAGRGAPWKIRFGRRNRRVTATTPMTFSGPAASDTRLSGGATGMLNNCSGGVTPWGTVLTCEENFNQYFAHNDANPDPVLKVTHARYGVPARATGRGWETVYPERFDVSRNPSEPLKHGWVVEVDPDDPASVPVKRTALGRFKHEAATVVVAPTGQVVVYSGDDQQFEHFYKFVSRGRYDRRRGKANARLLDDGDLHVARLRADGTADWIALRHGSRPELSAPHFADQADILLRTREAADAVGATKMDRPEDIEANPATGRVYVVLTNNSRRTAISPDAAEAAANPRSDEREGNKAGHILELTETGRQGHAGRRFSWDVFMLGGDGAGANRVRTPAAARGYRDQYYAGWNGPVSPIGSPDNLAFSPDGLMWVATDGASTSVGHNDALHAVPTTGPNRGEVRQFLSVPAGAETCGPVFTPDQSTLFVAVQHPGGGGALRVAGDPRTNSQSSWPDGPGNAPRPATIAVRATDGRRIGH